MSNQHCFHGDGYCIENAAETYWTEKCCRCGEERAASNKKFWCGTHNERHGPHVYVPLTEYKVVKAGDGSCGQAGAPPAGA